MLLKLLIRQLMKEQGVTFTVLDRMLGLKNSRGFVNLELVSSPQFQTLERILVALGAFKFDDEQVNELLKREAKVYNNTVKIVKNGEKGKD